MRICLFTDTLNDVNGVSRFIRNVGVQAALSGRSMHLITSTRFPPPPIPADPRTSAGEIDPASYLHNLPPVFARPMPAAQMPRSRKKSSVRAAPDAGSWSTDLFFRTL